MTTKPRAKKFRIRRSGTPIGGDRPAASEAPAAPSADVASPAQVASEATIDDIRKEGLTGRQLRMARRVAQKHGLAPTSDFDAVRLLRARGIDPFQRANMLELVVPDTDGLERAQEAAGGPPQGKVQLPQTVPQRGDESLPSTELAPAAARAKEILKIQRDIAKRRRRKTALLFTRLSFFVFLPTLIAGWYFYVLATPMYATKSEFLIQQAESQGAGGLGSLFGSSQLATVQDSIAVQGYLQSREAMLRLDEDAGFKAHFASPEIDLIQRLDTGASAEQAYRLYSRYVKIGYDPTEGIVKMEVIAADPQTSQDYAQRLISYAEERVDGITQRVREDAMRGARASYEEAEAKREEALTRVTRLQEELGVLDPTAASGELQSRITQLETMILEKELELASLLDNRRPNQARVEATQGEIRRLEDARDDVRALMTSSGSGDANQARKNAELRAAEEDYQTRTLLLQEALQQMETARIEAGRQVRYLSLGVTPVAPDEATYPRAFENTVLAFLIFAGIYLMLSLTASILREQVSN